MIILTLARKPVTGSIARNALQHGTGGINIDSCRLGTGSTVTRVAGGKGFGRNFRDDGWQPPEESFVNVNAGRWPANVVLQHKDGCRQIGTKTESGYVINRWDDGAKPFGGGAGHEFSSTMTPDMEVPVWDCAEGCPIAAMDEQSGDCGNGWKRNYGEIDYKGKQYKGGHVWGGGYFGGSTYAESGGASRFFKQFGGKR